MSWARKRQLSYLGIIILVIIVSIAFILWRLNPTPSCIDGIQNAQETGIDCGGGCSNVCQTDVANLNVLWARSFEVSPGNYDAAAYIENKNLNAAIEKIEYRFKIYDDDNILITEKKGQTFVGPNETAVIFQGNIDTGYQKPKRAFFEFNPVHQWTKVESLNKRGIKVYIKNKKFDNSTLPRLTATIYNDSIYNMRGVDISAVLFDAKDNAIAVSNTNLGSLNKNSSQDLIFTWPQPLEINPTRIEILPRINLFNIK